MNRKNKLRRQSERKLNKIIRHLCCWNCFQVGHNRFQCPYPKTNKCSFCRRPQVLSTNCGCEASREHLEIPEPQNVEAVNVPDFNQNVVVPVMEGNEVVAYEEVENFMVDVENESGSDCLELHAESDSLEDL